MTDGHLPTAMRQPHGLPTTVRRLPEGLLPSHMQPPRAGTTAEALLHRGVLRTAPREALSQDTPRGGEVCLAAPCSGPTWTPATQPEVIEGAGPPAQAPLQLPLLDAPPSLGKPPCPQAPREENPPCLRYPPSSTRCVGSTPRRAARSHLSSTCDAPSHWRIAVGNTKRSATTTTANHSSSLGLRPTNTSTSSTTSTKTT
jgi:hypothetical protein